MILGEAQFYDGRSPRAKTVRVAINQADATLELQELLPPSEASTAGAESQSVVRSVPMRELKLDAPIGSGAWALRLPEGAVVECPNGFYDALARHVRPSIGARFSLRAERCLKIAIGCFALSLALLFLFFQFGIPALAQRAAVHVPPEVEALVAKETLRLLDYLWFEPSELEPERKEELRDGFAALVARHPDAPDYEIHFRRSKIGPNAFALPAGMVLMTDELVELLDNDEQVYAVLAHELGHIHHNHGMRAALQATGHAVVITVFLGDVTSTLSVAAAMPSVLVEKGHSRKFEREADTYATEFALKTGLEAHHLIDALEHLTRLYGDGSSISRLSTHPPTPERVELIRSVERDAR